jgi:hypothetical protein
MSHVHRSADSRKGSPFDAPPKTHPGAGRHRKVAEALVQCWNCGEVQRRKRVRRCVRCGGEVEVLYTMDSNGVVINNGK